MKQEVKKIENEWEKNSGKKKGGKGEEEIRGGQKYCTEFDWCPTAILCSVFPHAMQ